MSETNPFYGDMDHSMITQDMGVCDICGRNCLRALCQQVTVVYGTQSKIASSVCAECMNRMQFKPQRVLDEDQYQRLMDTLTIAKEER
ncbi:hypothetical protein BCAL_0163 [Bifidobacterium callitrichos DSM 23973]|uniref:Uncharacterized protein n=2 Tax=Bifidobacterium callitrichos TaxID=762209 RepID=A0A087ACR8_9BIFI|nr:hypothetical protein BCAL_0163 [Bifidobacterium callitrichos DSM 23973]